VRVKVTQTCELGETPELVAQMLARAKRRLAGLSESRLNYWSAETLVAQISELRFSLADIDFMLEDAQNIVGGYIEAVSVPELPPDVSPSEEILPKDDPITMEGEADE